MSFNSIAQIVPASFTPVLLEELMFYLSTFRLDLSDGKIFTTMEWLMVFCQSTIVVDGFSMVFLHVNHWCRWFFNGFFHVNHWRQWFFNGFSDFNHWYQWFFQCFFPIQPLPLNEWFCGSPLTSMVYQWFWEKLKLVHKKGQKTKKSMICSTNT